jgi:sulfonate transport system permease protein
MKAAKALVFPLALLVLAEIGARKAAPSDSVAPPSEIFAAFLGAVEDGSLFVATRDTLISAFGGLLVGASLGLVVGLTLGSLRTLDRLLELALELLRPVPSVAVIPIALVALGFGYRLEIAIVAVACFWPPLILSRAAVRGVEPRLIEVAHALRLSPLQETAKIIAPAALPRIFVAFRLAAGIALVVAVTVEITVNPQGLGYETMTAGQALRPALMLAYIVWIGVVGYALNAALVLAQARLFGEAGRVEATR